MITRARIRTRWKDKGRQVSLAEMAAAVAAVAWRVALNAAKNLHEQDFVYDTDEQRLGVVQEYLAFFIHGADRLTIDRFSDEQRIEFLTELSTQCRRHLAENEQAITGKRAMADVFIPFLNKRLDQLAGTRFEQDSPGYATYRVLGSGILGVMGESQTNKWVQDHVMDIDGPEAWSIFRKALRDIQRSASPERA